MHYRTFGTTGWNVSEIGFGAWAIGGSWGGQKGVDDSRYPQQYLVDYVRIYQQR